MAQGSPRGRWAAFEDLLVITILVLLGFPDKNQRQLYVGEIPVLFLLYWLLSVFVLVRAVVSRRHRTVWNAVSGAGLALLVLMGCLSFAHRAEPGFRLRFVVIDATVVSGLLIGALWASMRASSAILRVLKLGAVVSMLSVGLTIAGLSYGLIEGSGGGWRKYTQEMFLSAYVLAVFAPVLILTRSLGSERSGRRRARIGFASIGVVFLAGLYTGTRSTTLCAIVSLGLCLFMRVKVRSRVFGPAVCLALVGIVCWSVVGRAISAGREYEYETTVFGRLANTSLEEEQRSVELTLMFDDLGSDAIWGRGLGSRFFLGRLRRQYDYGSTPHMGIFAFLMKGGVLGFSLAVVVPALLALGKLVWARSRVTESGWWCSIIVYLCNGAISGGWTFCEVFFYGSALSMVLASRSIDKQPTFLPDGPVSDEWRAVS